MPVRRIISCAAIAGCVAAASLAVHGTGQQSPGDTARRVAERLAVLRQEADTLAKQEASILNELRKLELQRQIRIEELTALEVELRTTTEQLAAATGRAEALRKSAESQQPDVERRLVRLYKMGRAGYWRLLLDVEDIQSMGRAYRTAAALTEIDRRRIAEHARTIDALEREQVTLRDRASEVTSLRRTATEARVALDKAVASRAALVKSIETRRDLATGLAAELDAAYLRLQSTIAQNPTAAAIGLPIRPFKGDLPWPADGIVVSRFGRERSSRMSGMDFSRNGIELSLAEGRPVTAVHDGVVTHAGPFTAYGQLVIIDHGGGAVTLYGHLASTNVNKGDRVATGTNIGTSGRNTSGNPSVYFELRIDAQPVDPLQWLRRQP